MTEEFLRRSSRAALEHRSWTLRSIPGVDLGPLPLGVTR